MPTPNSLPIPNTPFLDARTGLVSREWTRFLFSLNRNTSEAVSGEILTPSGSGLEGGGFVADGITLSIADNGVTFGMFQQVPACSVIGRFQNSTGNVSPIQAVANDTILARMGNQLAFYPISAIPATVADGDYGDITVSGTGLVWTIDANVVTNAKLAQIATARFKGRVTVATGNVEDLTGTQATTLLDAFTSSLKGLAPASGGGTANYLRADGSWAAPPGATSGTVTSVSVVTANGVSGSVATATTTPAITLTLGAITPSSVAATGQVTAGAGTGIFDGDSIFRNSTGLDFTVYGGTAGIGGAFVSVSGNTAATPDTIIFAAAGGTERARITSSGLNLSGSFAAPIVTKTANYTATGDDYTILCDATGGAITITLPAASGVSGRIYIVKKIDASANTVTIDGNASETIDGATTQVISAQWASLTIQCNGTAWFVV